MSEPPSASSSLIDEAPAEVVIDAILAGPDDSTPDAEASERHLAFSFWLSVGWVVVIAGTAFLAPYLPLDDPNQTRAGPPRSGITSEHWLGTDNLGRDIFSRVVWGARVSLLVGFASIAFGLVVGGTLGILAGFFGGLTERGVMFVSDILLSFPAVVLALLLVSFLGRELQWILLAIGILSIAPIARLSRAATLVFAQREFVVAARAQGAKSMRIMVREILPNVLIPMSALALLGIAIAIVAEGSLAFLGLSVVDQISWGALIVEGSSPGQRLQQQPLMAFAPITAMFLTVLALNFAGDRLRDYFDVKEGAL